MEEQKEKSKLSTKTIILIIISIILIITCFILWARFISTKGLKVQEIKIENTSLDEKYDGLKIVQFSDLHYKSTINKKETEKLVETINKQNADIVVFTGDLVNDKATLSEEEQKELVDLLNKIEAKIEKYTVKGNHDYKNDYYNTIMSQTDFVALDNTYDYFYKDTDTPIIIVGIDDYSNGKPDIKNAFSFINDFEEQPYTILLLHEPDQADEVINEYSFNIAFAGHSHLGQVRLPFIGATWTPNGAKKYTDSHYKVNDSDLYISGGLGTSVLKLRFINKPSITLYRFYTK